MPWRRNSAGRENQSCCLGGPERVRTNEVPPEGQLAPCLVVHAWQPRRLPVALLRWERERRGDNGIQQSKRERTHRVWRRAAIRHPAEEQQLSRPADERGDLDVMVAPCFSHNPKGQKRRRQSHSGGVSVVSACSHYPRCPLHVLVAFLQLETRGGPCRLGRFGPAWDSVPILIAATERPSEAQAGKPTTSPSAFACSRLSCAAHVLPSCLSVWRLSCPVDRPPRLCFPRPPGGRC